MEANLVSRLQMKRVEGLRNVFLNKALEKCILHEMDRRNRSTTVNTRLTQT